MKTTELIELQKTITQGDWQIARNDFAQWVTNEVGKAQIAKAFTPAGMPLEQSHANLRAISLVPQLIAEVIRLRSLIGDANQQLAKMDFNSSPNWNGALKTNVALLLDAALANK